MTRAKLRNFDHLPLIRHVVKGILCDAKLVARWRGAIELGLLRITIDGITGLPVGHRSGGAARRAERWSDRLYCMKWPYNKRFDPALGGAVITVGVAGLFGIPGILASLNASHPHYHWAWPTNWMAVPAALVVIGFGLLVVPWRRVEPPESLPPIDPGIDKYSITLISDELMQWQTFLAAAAQKHWIGFVDETMPTADGLVGDDGSIRYVLTEPLKANLIVVYRYLTALVEAHDCIKRWQKSDQPLTVNKKSKDSGLGDFATDVAASALATIGTFGVRYYWLSRKLKRAQEKDKEYQEHLQALPDILSELRGDLKAVGTGSSIDSKTQAPIKLPMVPVIDIGSNGSIDFELVPVKSYG